MLHEVNFMKHNEIESRRIYLALVAVNQKRMVRAIQYNPQSLGHLASLDPDFTLVGRNGHLEVLNAVVIHKLAILGRDFHIDKGSEKVSASWSSFTQLLIPQQGGFGQDRLQLETLQKLVILPPRITTTVDGAWYHGTVVHRRK